MSTVDIPALTRIGEAVTQTAPAFDRAHAARADTLGLRDGRGVWAAAEAVASAADVWAGFLRQLAGQVRDVGSGLTASAREYAIADIEAARRTGDIPAGHPAIGRAYGYDPR